MKRIWKKLVTLALVLVVAALLVPSPEPAVAAISPDGWGTQVSGTTRTLYGVWGSSESDVFAVGSSGTVRHYGGSTWGSITSGTTRTLYGVWGSSFTNVFTVGQNGAIRRYNGTTWGSMASGTNRTLYGVWGSSSTNVFAVGQSGTIRRFNGTSWSGMNSHTGNTLRAVWGTASNDVFAVGSNGTVVHYNGTSWSTMTSSTTRTLYGVWGIASNNVFAVGTSGAIIRYNGTTWSTMTSGVGDTLNSVWGTSSDDVFAVGANGRILHWNGTDWDPMDSGITSTLQGVWGTDPLNVYAAGQAGTILHYDELLIPSITAVDPSEGNQGESLAVVISGEHFTGTTSVDFGAGVNTDNFAMDNDAQMTANISISPSATTGTRDVSVTTSHGTDALTDGFTVFGVSMTSADPNFGNPGQTLAVELTGANLTETSAVDFGAGITVNGFTIDNPTQITANITIAGGAAEGPRDITVTTPNGSAALDAGFTVGASLTKADPDSGNQGDILDVVLTGTNLAGTSAVDFGAGITVSTFNVDSPNQIAANITIANGAAAGARDITVTTPNGPTTLTAGFAVGSASLSEANPNSGIQDQTLAVVIAGTNLTGATAIDFGAGITVNSLIVDNPNQITVNITIANHADAGPRDITVTTPNGTATLDAGFTVGASLTGANPDSGNQGETLDVVITGTNLTGASAVDFGAGIAVNGYIVDNPNQITADITIADSADAGPRSITVTTPNGTPILDDGFTVSNADLTGADPASGKQGQTLNVVITGANLTGATAVDFGAGITTNSFNVDGPNQITANITVDAAAAAGDRNITVTTPNGSPALTGGFAVGSATLTGANPASGNQGQTLNVVITGANLTGATAVDFGAGITTNSFNVDGPNQITANITIDAAAAAGVRNITVTTPNGSPVLTGGFTVGSATLTGANPASGNQGQTLNVVITGANLTGATAVDFGAGITTNSFNVDGPNQITANITVDAAAAAGVRNITVTTPNGSPVLTGGFAVGSATLTGANPASGNQGQTLNVVITGANLTGATAVDFGAGITTNSFNVDNPNQITANITMDAAAAAGVRNITVTAPNGNPSLANGFTVTMPVPNISEISPRSGRQGQNLDVVIVGSNLTGVTAVDFDADIAVNRLDVDVLGQRVTANITINASAVTGTRDVSVTTPGGHAVLSNSFTVMPPAPTVDGVNPPSGRAGDTFDVVITGSNFTGASAVDFGSGVTVNSLVVDSPSQITANITIDRAAEPGDRNIVVSTPSGDGLLTEAFGIATSEDASSVSGSWWFWLLMSLLALGLGLFLFALIGRRRKGPNQPQVPTPTPSQT